MARVPEFPQWAMVIWPDRATLACVRLEDLMVATMRGAILLADERWILPLPVYAEVPIDPAQSNPNRHGE